LTDKKQPKKQKSTKLPKEILKEIKEMAAYYKPRDPARIPKVLDALKELWSLEPDTRLGQLLLNFAFRGGDCKEKTNYLMYEQEDDLTLDLILKTLKREKTSRGYSDHTYVAQPQQ
jgi:uncharacterized protein YihD (DUF1040 family)